MGNPAVRPGFEIGERSYALIAYPPLSDPTLEMDRLAQTGEFASLSRNAYACFSPAPPDTTASFVEFYNATLDHYFYSGSADEIAAIDAGRVGPWTRTGRSFRATTVPGCPSSSRATVVYRFYGVPGRGPNSHFFTRDRSECHVVDKSGQWDLEGIAFWASVSTPTGACAATEASLYRLWKPFGDSNHRFTTDRAVVSEMVSKGWVDEGVSMCVLR